MITTKKINPKIKLVFLLFCGAIIWTACKKNETPVYRLAGTIVDGVNGSPLADVNVKIEKQTVDGSNFNGVFNLADQVTTNSNGTYNAEWERENIVELRASLSKSQFIPVVKSINVSSLSTSDELTQNFEMYPEANVKITFLKNPNLTQNQQFNFRFENASFDCFCCNNDWVSYTPSVGDTSKTCQVYGDRWLKYRYELIRATQDSLVRDSIYCPRFELSEVTINW